MEGLSVRKERRRLRKFVNLLIMMYLRRIGLQILDLSIYEDETKKFKVSVLVLGEELI